MTTTIPIIDLAPLDRGDDGLRSVAREVGEACRGIGFFYIRNAAIPKELREAVFAAAHAFFASELAAKDAVAIRHSPHNRGYVGMQVEALDPSRGPDCKEAFNVGLELDAADPDLLAGRAFRGPNLWPSGSPAFRTTLLRYYEAAWQVGRDLHRAIAVDLGLPEHVFADKLDKPMATLRLLHYPPSPASWGRESTPTTATSPCSPPTRSAASRCAAATAAGCRRPWSRTPSCATSAIA